jgi:hypothetical protein
MTDPVSIIRKRFQVSFLPAWWIDPESYQLQLLAAIEKTRKSFRRGNLNLEAVVSTFYQELCKLAGQRETLERQFPKKIVDATPDGEIIYEVPNDEDFERLEEVVCWTRNTLRPEVLVIKQELDCILADENTRLDARIIECRLPLVVICETDQEIGFLPLDKNLISRVDSQLQSLSVQRNSAVYPLTTTRNLLGNISLPELARRLYPGYPVWLFSSRAAEHAPMIGGQFYLARMMMEGEVATW